VAVDARPAGHGSWYSEARWARFAPLAGVLAVILWVIGLSMVETAADQPDDDAQAAAFVQFFEEGAGRLVAGAFLFMVGSAVFLWFLGTLRARVHAGEGGPGRLASIVFAAGIVIAAMSMAFAAPYAAGGFAAGELGVTLDPGAAQALSVLDDGFFIAAEAATAVFFLALAVALLRTRALPVWLAWASLVLGVVALLPWIGWAAFIWGLPLWVLIASVWMFVRPAPVAPGEGRAASA
jgi:hypothetical protein